MESQALKGLFGPLLLSLAPMVRPHVLCMKPWGAGMIVWFLLQACDLGISPKEPAPCMGVCVCPTKDPLTLFPSSLPSPQPTLRFFLSQRRFSCWVEVRKSFAEYSRWALCSGRK